MTPEVKMDAESIKKDGMSVAQVAELLIDTSLPQVSNLANLSRALFDGFRNVSWAGFYLANDEGDTLYLGPYQGPLACTVIPFSKGVCGYCATTKKTVLVEDVHSFPGHIACSSLTNSELVAPIIKNGRVVAVIDLDSNERSNFTEDDARCLEEVAQIISTIF